MGGRGSLRNGMRRRPVEINTMQLTMVGRMMLGQVGSR